MWKLELLPLSRKAHVMTDLSLPFTLTLTGITAMPVLQSRIFRPLTLCSELFHQRIGVET